MARQAPIEMLIQEALDAGYDIKITIRQREPIGDGRLTLPNSWARRLGMTDAEMARLRHQATQDQPQEKK